MQLFGPFRYILRGSSGGAAAAPRLPKALSFRQANGQAEPEETATRASRGLEEFFRYIRDQSGLTILDLGGATQQNVSFITNLGHRLYSEDFLRTLQDVFGAESGNDQSNPGQIEFFLKQTLDYPEGHFDAVLIWDTLEHLSPPLLAAVLERLRRIVRPKSYMLSFFHADDRLEMVPYYTFRIQGTTQLHVTQRGTRRPVQLFNNRSLEKLFASYDSVKFFLTRERLREVIVKV